MAQTTTAAKSAKNTSKLNVKNQNGLYESTFGAAALTIVSDRPIVEGQKYRGTYQVRNIEYGDGEFRTEPTIHREYPERRYYTIGETENGSVKLNAKRVRMVLEMPYAAVDEGQDIAACFAPQAKALLAKLRKVNTFLCDHHAYMVMEAQAEARAEVEREKNLEALRKSHADR